MPAARNRKLTLLALGPLLATGLVLSGCGTGKDPQGTVVDKEVERECKSKKTSSGKKRRKCDTEYELTIRTKKGTEEVDVDDDEYDLCPVDATFPACKEDA